MKTSRALNSFLFKIELLILFVFSASSFSAQCISTFPHTESFESGPVWTSGGVNNDWAWGTPAKPTINSAGGGTKCWNAGGLTGNSYASSQESFIKSPCYDFTNLNNPFVSVKVFWETEKTFDGASLQYSINNGLSWITVGAFGDPQNCMTQNWYNNSNVTYLSWVSPPNNKNGWSGNDQNTSGTCLGGGGSGQWKTAKHCLVGLANKPNVQFRFAFGSGSLCNNFDGFSIDDFVIDEAPFNMPDFIYGCTTFSAQTLNTCPAPATYYWNFGDPFSGNDNTSSQANPVHIYNTPGDYSVHLTISGGPCNQSGTIIKVFSITNPTITGISNVSCFGGNNGSATVTANFGSGTHNYTWSPSGGNGSIATGLSPGNYQVTVSNGNNCFKTTTLQITQPVSMSSTITQTNVNCNPSSVGSASVTVNGGNTPYTYTWAPSGGNLAQATNLSVGNYSVLVQDAKLCQTSKTVAITSLAKPTSSISPNNAICFGLSTGSLSINTSGGLAPYTYTWLPSGGNSTTASGLSVGTYTCFVADNNNCTVSNTASIVQNSQVVATTSNYTVCANASTVITGAATGGLAPYVFYWNNATNGTPSATVSVATNATFALVATDANNCSSLPVTSSVTLYPAVKAQFTTDKKEASIMEPIIQFNNTSSSNAVAYQWNFDGVASSTLTSPSYTYNFEGTYEVQLTVQDNNGCKDSVSDAITIVPEITFFAPNAFTPNDNNMNDVFIPKGTGWDATKYEFWVFDRWGSVVFYTKDPLMGWNGKTKNGAALLPNDNYVWKVELTDILDKEHVYLGNVFLSK